MDPMGFSLENFDVIGRWREDDGGGPIDASGRLPDGRTFEGPRQMASLLKADPDVPRCIVEKLFTYALGRGPVAADRCVLDDIEAGFARDGYVLEDLILHITASPAFLGTSAVREDTP